MGERENAAGLATRLHRWMPRLTTAAVILLGVLCVEALRHLAADLRYDEIVAAVRETSLTQFALAIAATAISFLALTGYDRSALRYVGADVPYRVVAQASFIAYAVGNTIGLGMLTGGAVRMRLYSAAGLEAGRIGRAIAFNAASFALGTAIVGAGALLWAAEQVGAVIHVHAAILRLLSGVFLGATVALFWKWRNGGAQKLWRLTFQVPSLPLLAAQVLISAIDIAASAAVLWFLLPSGSIGFVPFVAFYAAGIVLGVLSHLPGGIGVFEAVMLAALKNTAPTGALAGALVLYRVIYYVVPLVLALVWLVVHELHRARNTPVMRAMVSLTPTLLAALTLIIGSMLLISGVLPATDEATALLEMHVPLPLVEAAHFLGSIAGLALLFVARGMLNRLDAAWWAGVALGVLSLVLSLPKGIAVTEAVVLASWLVLLTASRSQFTRRASLLDEPFSLGWTAATAAILLAITCLLFLVYRDVEYTHDLWWQFEFDAHAPRSLRAMVAVTLVALALALRQLFRPASPTPASISTTDLDRAANIVRQQETADAGLALLGDKQLLFSDSGQAFVMYGRRAQSWVALFDPVGPAKEVPELIWRFLERAREAGGRASFYQVRPEYLPHYLDAGMRLLKLGEYAAVSLPEFTLKGSSRSGLRQSVNRAEREELSFEILPIERVPAVIEEIKTISDAWLEEHSTAEKGFSLGAFDPAYVRRHPAALVRKQDRLIAFATLLTTDRRMEATVDLMRHLPGAPSGTMDFLFIKLMLHFQAEGFQRFGLGMAPLSGMATHPLAPNWHRLGRLLFSHGEHFYNFQGLRAFKEKFAPQWQPRYLAAYGVVAPFIVLADTAVLISGGLRTVISK